MLIFVRSSAYNYMFCVKFFKKLKLVNYIVINILMAHKTSTELDPEPLVRPGTSGTTRLQVTGCL